MVGCYKYNNQQKLNKKKTNFPFHYNRLILESKMHKQTQVGVNVYLSLPTLIKYLLLKFILTNIVLNLS